MRSLNIIAIIALFWSIAIGHAQSDIVSLGNLPDLVKETSGLLYYNGNLITHNDSDNAPLLYVLDVDTRAIVRTVEIDGAVNNDWEDLSQDDDYIYIADIGNNLGDRQDLSVLRILKSNFDSSDLVSPEYIFYNYEDQFDFTPSENSDFDAEALVSMDDGLIVLTKQWQSQATAAYRIPKTPGNYVAENVGAYQVDGLVTGATFDSDSSRLYLTGYSQFLFPFFIKLENVTETAIFGDIQERTSLSIGAAQVESIDFVGETFYLTSEEFINPPLLNTRSRLFSFTLDDENDNGDDIDDGNDNGDGPDLPVDGNRETLIAFKPSGSAVLNYELTTEKAIFGMGIFDSTGRMVLYVPPERIRREQINISQLSTGLHYLVFFFQDDIAAATFFKD